MKKHLSYAVAILIAVTAVATASPETDGIEAKEKAAWQAYKDKKSDDFKKLTAAEYVGVYSDGTYDIARELASMMKVDMKSFTLSDFKVTMPDANTAIATYKAKVEAKMGGEDESANYNVGSVWIKQNGEWRNVFHTNVDIDDDDDTPAAAKK